MKKKVLLPIILSIALLSIFVFLGGTCETCSNECSSSGQTRCNPSATNQIDTCSNYDSDSCLEWGATGTCGVDTGPAGSTCSNGQCVVSCTPATCSSLGKTCGSWSDGCNGILSCGTCASGYTCSNGQCVVSCTPTYYNNCDNTDGCGGNRTVPSGYNSCNLTSNIPCFWETAFTDSNSSTCFDMIDNDCNNLIDTYDAYCPTYYCSDSDGKTFTIKGNTTISSPPTFTQNFIDSCNTTIGYTSYARDYYCQTSLSLGNNPLRYEDKDCTTIGYSNCVDGACVP